MVVTFIVNGHHTPKQSERNFCSMTITVTSNGAYGLYETHVPDLWKGTTTNNVCIYFQFRKDKMVFTTLN